MDVCDIDNWIWGNRNVSKTGIDKEKFLVEEDSLNWFV